MTEIAHKQTQPIGFRLRLNRNVAWMVAALVAIACAAVVLALTLNDSDKSASVSLPTSAQAFKASGERAGGPQESVALHGNGSGVRYDGGPEEGTAAVQAQSLQTGSPTPSQVRYDGGPEEGTVALGSGGPARMVSPQIEHTFGARP